MIAFFQVAEGARLLFLYQEEPRSAWRRAGFALIGLPLFALLLLLLGAVPLAIVPILLAWIWSRAELKEE
jgi:fatty acid desaturase